MMCLFFQSQINHPFWFGFFVLFCFLQHNLKMLGFHFLCENREIIATRYETLTSSFLFYHTVFIHLFVAFSLHFQNVHHSFVIKIWNLKLHHFDYKRDNIRKTRNNNI